MRDKLGKFAVFDGITTYPLFRGDAVKRLE
jgi:hypothetical protein